jgi:DNA-binding transcriptional ArsR family regulator
MELSDQMLDVIARRFRMLGEPQRLRILQALESGEHTVGSLVAQLQGNQPNISKHLQALYDAGLVGRRRSGNSVLYFISDPVIFRVCELVCRSAAKDARAKLSLVADRT